MVYAEIAIRKQIKEITIDRIAVVKQDIKRDIKYVFWQGMISEYKYNVLNDLLDKKVNAVLDEYFDRISEAYDKHLSGYNRKR